jgi:hypothetical protein
LEVDFSNLKSILEALLPAKSQYGSFPDVTKYYQRDAIPVNPA